MRLIANLLPPYHILEKPIPVAHIIKKYEKIIPPTIPISIFAMNEICHFLNPAYIKKTIQQGAHKRIAKKAILTIPSKRWLPGLLMTIINISTNTIIIGKAEKRSARFFISMFHKVKL